MKFKELNQFRDDYCADYHEELKLFYKGGHEFLKNADKYLTKDISESQTRFQNRVQSVGYINFFSQIVDYFSSQVFTKSFAVVPQADSNDQSTLGDDTTDPVYQEFIRCSDLENRPLSAVLKEALTNALIHEDTYLILDFPAIDEIPNSALDQPLQVPYLSLIPNNCVIDYSKNDNEDYDYIVIKREVCKKQFAQAPQKVIEFKVWIKTEDNKVIWQLYRTAPIAKDKEPKADDELTLVSEGETSFLQIPVIQLDLDSLWIGDKIHSLCKEHFNRRSALVSSEANSLFSVPVAYLGSEIGAMAPMVEFPSEVQSNPNRADQFKRSQLEKLGYAVFGSGDRAEYLEPTGAAYTIVDSQLKDLSQQIFSSVNALAQSIGVSDTTLGRSGLSKSVDAGSTIIIVKAYANVIKDAIKKIYNLIAQARGEDVLWEIVGLDTYEVLPDRQALISEAMAITNLSIPSKSFTIAYTQKIANQLLENVNPELAITINSEIKEAIEAGEHGSEPPTPEQPSAEAPLDGGEAAPSDAETVDG